MWLMLPPRYENLNAKLENVEDVVKAATAAKVAGRIAQHRVPLQQQQQQHSPPANREIMNLVSALDAVVKPEQQETEQETEQHQVWTEEQRRLAEALTMAQQQQQNGWNSGKNIFTGPN